VAGILQNFTIFIVPNRIDYTYIVFTHVDRKTNRGNLRRALRRLRKTNIKMFVMGIGKEIKKSELKQINSSRGANMSYAKNFMMRMIHNNRSPRPTSNRKHRNWQHNLTRRRKIVGLKKKTYTYTCNEGEINPVPTVGNLFSGMVHNFTLLIVQNLQEIIFIFMECVDVKSNSGNLGRVVRPPRKTNKKKFAVGMGRGISRSQLKHISSSPAIVALLRQQTLRYLCEDMLRILCIGK